MTPDALRAAIASARLRPRMYAQTAEHLASMLYGMIAGAASDGVDIGPAWGDAYSPANVHAPADAEVCDAAEATVAALWPQGDAPALAADYTVENLRARIQERLAERRAQPAPEPTPRAPDHDAVVAEIEALLDADDADPEGMVLAVAPARRAAEAGALDLDAVLRLADDIGPGELDAEAVGVLLARVRELESQLAAAQPVLMLDAIRRGPPSTWVRCLACGGTRADVEGAPCEPCRGTGQHPPPSDADLCPKSAATVAGEAFAAEHPYAAGAIMGSATAREGKG